MEFENQRKEVTAVVIRELLDTAGYYLIEYSVEKTAREVTPMNYDGYRYV